MASPAKSGTSSASGEGRAGTKAKGGDSSAARSGEPPRRRADDHQTAALRNEVMGIAILAASLCLMLALASFNPEDVSPTGTAAQTGRAHNLIGPVGAYVADIFLSFMGVAAFLFPISMALPGVCFLTGRRIQVRPIDVIGYPVLVWFCGIASHLLLKQGLILGRKPGGAMGEVGGEILKALVGETGAFIVVYSVLALTFILTTRISLVGLASRATLPMVRGVKALFANFGGLSGVYHRRVSRLNEWRAERAKAQAEEDAQKVKRRAEERQAREAQREADRQLKAERKAAKARPEPDEPELGMDEPRAPKRRNPPKVKPESLNTVPPVFGSGEFSLGGREAPRDEGFRLGERERLVDSGEYELDEEDDDRDTVAGPGLTPPRRVEEPTIRREERAPRREEPLQPVVRGRKAPEEPLGIALPENENYDNYELPPLHLLDHEEQEVPEADPRALKALAERLVQTLATFKIEGRVTEIHPGPVVTMFEFEPAPGVRISKIASLADDVAMALKAVKVRIVAPIPGKGVVGFEVPNEEREMVFLKEIIGSAAFNNKKLALPMALGKDIHGNSAVTDLAKMPHLLVAGTTGSGKSVGVNGMITSLLYRYSPEDVRFLMVDPKMLELSIYEGIPHLLLPVVTDPKKAAMALKWATDEMDRRYELMKDAGVRDIRGYNRKVELALAGKPDEELDEELDGLDTHQGPAVSVSTPKTKLPYIVVVIDEFADLMMVAGKEVEFCVARIAQKARAAGIHLILATQRPSTDVITGVIKANFPTRMAFQVSSGIDSRTILSTNGAENLLGKGDMLYLPPGTSRLVRVHGAFVSENEIHRIVEFIRAQKEPEYLDESILKPRDEEGDEEEDGASDEMYEEVVRTIYRDGRASTSHIQRRLSLGYNRAARIMDQLEKDGLIGPGSGAKPRPVNKGAIAQLIARWDRS